MTTEVYNARRSKPPTLRAEEELEILEFIVNKAKTLEPVQRKDVTDKVVKILHSDNRRNPFRNGVPGDKWFSLFRRRHNSHFLELGPKMLKIVESLGFTEKVTNTVTYPRPRIDNEINRSKGSKNLTADETSPQIVSLSSSPGSEDGTDDGDRSQESLSDSTDFQPGSKLEVMDFNEKWYPVKVVEVDYEEGEVLVHFEKWSDRFDEWVRMDSNRIRRPKLQHGSNSKKVFTENEKVIAVWAYNHKYPATVREVLPNGLSEKEEGGRKRNRKKIINEEGEEKEKEGDHDDEKEEVAVVENETVVKEEVSEEEEHEYEFEKVFLCEDLETDEQFYKECLDKIKLEPTNFVDESFGIGSGLLEVQKEPVSKTTIEEKRKYERERKRKQRLRVREEPTDFVDESSFGIGSGFSEVQKEPVSETTKQIICEKNVILHGSKELIKTKRLSLKDFRLKTNKPKKTIEEKRKYERERKRKQRLRKVREKHTDFVDESSFGIGGGFLEVQKEIVRKTTKQIICEENVIPHSCQQPIKTERLSPKEFRSKKNKPNKTIEEKRKYERERKRKQRAREKEEYLLRLKRKESRILHGFPVDYCYKCYQEANRPKIIRKKGINTKHFTVEEARAYATERKREWRSKKRLQEKAEEEENNPFKDEPCYCKKKKTKSNRGRPRKKTKRFLKTQQTVPAS